MSDINVDGMRVVDLREELKERGLDAKVRFSSSTSFLFLSTLQDACME